MTTFLVYCSKNRDVAVLVTDCSIHYITVEEVPVRRLSFPLTLLSRCLASAAVKTAAAVILVISPHT
jgi:hypothetical protein